MSEMTQKPKGLEVDKIFSEKNLPQRTDAVSWQQMAELNSRAIQNLREVFPNLNLGNKDLLEPNSNKSKKLHDKGILNFVEDSHIEINDPLNLEFYSINTSASPEAREYLSSLSSSIIEPDVYFKIKNDPIRYQEIVMQLSELGLSPDAIDTILKYFNLDATKNSQEKEKTK